MTHCMSCGSPIHGKAKRRLWLVGDNQQYVLLHPEFAGLRLRPTSSVGMALARHSLRIVIIIWVQSRRHNKAAYFFIK